MRIAAVLVRELRLWIQTIESRYFPFYPIHLTKEFVQHGASRDVVKGNQRLTRKKIPLL
jgi:hypothetical protein